VPNARRHVVLERGDPLSGVLRGTSRLDGALVIGTRGTRQSHLNLRLLGLDRLHGLARPIAVAIARLDGIDAKGQVLACGVRQLTRCGETLARELRVCTMRSAEAHLTTSTIGRRVPKDPR